MRTAALLPVLLCALMLTPAGSRAAPRRVQPVVVELYTSQGCSACLKADELVGDLAGRKGVLPLTFAVDYWDYLGWRDTFAQPEFSTRQRAYMKRLGQREVYTPQAVVDGRGQAAAGRPEAVEKLIQQARRAPRAAPSMRFLRGDKVSIGPGAAPRGGGEVWLVRYEERPAEVVVKDGENRGETVAYRHAVRELKRLGPWTGRQRTYVLPKAESPDLKSVVLLQGAAGGRMLGVLTR